MVIAPLPYTLTQMLFTGEGGAGKRKARRAGSFRQARLLREGVYWHCLMSARSSSCSLSLFWLYTFSRSWGVIVIFLRLANASLMKLGYFLMSWTASSSFSVFTSTVAMPSDELLLKRAETFLVRRCLLCSWFPPCWFDYLLRLYFLGGLLSSWLVPVLL